MQIKHLILVALLATPLAGCLENDVQRAAAGAAAGAVIADVTNGDVLTGAVIGAGAGALCDDAGVCN
ncbi:YMGG-like glycine zipper-containing protein [Profundibacter amoris]|uniref:YMGG-like Gly-zipper domain-containing protein n=1 Tax=Profundibacter amoris TaxID=2171755 RepID=A0A347UHU5_9RHOB|nr:YMGG-like glycine zipper-containing protein [Profundibacter amoris]AXX98423.1 hypothetical protein BAR1_11095 [Profundibacter amoris]